MYLRTGEMADMFHLNKQTLLYYDKEGILRPEYREPETGYRKYRFVQVYRLALICYLRKIGFSIEQIRSYIGENSVEESIKDLKARSAKLRETYRDILKLDDVIQRKLYFVEHRLKEIQLGEVVERYYLKRAYLPLGIETAIYRREEFYFYPTIAFYHYCEAEDRYEKTFGAYLESADAIAAEVAEEVCYIEAQRFLCFYWKGSYDEIEHQIRSIRKQYNHLNLSNDSCNFNVVDQFLEKDTEKYITEIQIPILD